MWKRHGIAITATIFLVSLLHSCAAQEQKTISGTGSIKYIGLEGGFYGIVADDGKRYDPVNLPEEFRQDGLRVRIELRPRPDMASLHMWGMIVEVLKIEKLE